MLVPPLPHFERIKMPETRETHVASAKHDIEAYASDTMSRIGVVSNHVVQLIEDKTKEDSSGSH